MNRKTRKTLLERFLTIFGDIKAYPRWNRPLWILYQPEGYKVRGQEIREFLERIQVGDVLVRGFNDYLDGYFIPGYFSHVGLYLGEVAETDKEYVGKQARGLKGPDSEPVFRTGKQMVIHALAEGVILEDVINFCRCDYLAALRFPAELRRTGDGDLPLLARSSYSDPEWQIHERIARGETVTFNEAFPCIKAAALGKLGARYDFEFEFNRFDRLSCSELVYFATKLLAGFHRVQARNGRVMWFFRRSFIEPDAFVRAPLEVAWKSGHINQAAFAALRQLQPSTIEPKSRAA